MNRYPLWKNLIVVVVVLVGLFYALPNFFGEEPALQISKRDGAVEQTALAEAQSALRAAGIDYTRSETQDESALIRFPSTDEQLEAVDVVRAALGGDYPVALNLAPAAPDWLTDLGALPMYLGLDLRGGVHFLMQVDMDAAIKTALERRVDGMRADLRQTKLRYVSAEVGDDQRIRVRFRDAADRDQAIEQLTADYEDLTFDESEIEGEPYLVAKMTEEGVTTERRAALEQNITTLRNRVNELGVAEPLIQQQGEDRIVVELPGIQDTVRAKEILGATATLEFRLVHGTPTDWMEADDSGSVPPQARLYQRRGGGPVLLKRQVIVTGDRVTGASSGFDQDSGSPAVFVNLDSQGARRMADITGDNIGQQMGVVFIENRTDSKVVDGKLVEEKRRVEEVINVATIRDQLANRFQITGLDSPEEARNLALLLRAGALRAPMDIVEERTVGPSLGAENIQAGVNAAILGFVLVAIFMMIYYRVFGVIAVVALVTNLILIVAVLSMLQATLTLPGIAGIVLTVGMAVDANVLIFERIREELRNGMTPHAAMKAGYERAFATILDANITTLLAALALFAFGTGPIKGFAVTLSIGILASMFTAVMLSRALANLIYGRQARLKGLSI
ncbi:MULTISPECIES: protein translocase subunit SecD [unclassified Guyparkeria]|uniref:protein translocase subunit SecD n=1 Tax=unclassified Guyparkeria TaxID=2626246 RepID=UPI0007334252|nr:MULTISPECIES: protein translocase subunit SecD [unclassified Guyparkeria]KTG16776.1 preprotein translocase subunit SecD [Guyparkeria sp. XI15]OAE85810.1 preprotein translocase subunit SecD [Guyparkeria sp. WRN-7]